MFSVRTYFFFCALVSTLLPLNSSYALTLDWDSAGASLPTLAMSGAELSAPLTGVLPPWAKVKTSDASWLLGNATLTSELDESKGRWEAASLKLESGGAFTSFEAATPFYSDIDALRQSLGDGAGSSHVSKFEVGTRYFERGMGTSFSYSRKRLAFLKDDGSVELRSHRDFNALLGVSGPIFEKEHLGRLEFGTSIKTIFRKGDEVSYAAAASGDSLDNAEFTKSAFAGGLDYSMLYALPKKWTKNTVVQLALVWKDVGTTQFFIGNSTSQGRRFEAFPNNQSFGIGVGLPNIWRGFRGAIRLEYKEWKRQISFVRKSVLGLELRAPEILSVYAGLRGNLWSLGAGLRFPFVEVCLSTHARFYGEGEETFEGRNYALEIKGVF
jgi:hypothetical protein